MRSTRDGKKLKNGRYTAGMYSAIHKAGDCAKQRATRNVVSSFRVGAGMACSFLVFPKAWVDLNLKHQPPELLSLQVPLRVMSDECEQDLMHPDSYMFRYPSRRERQSKAPVYIGTIIPMDLR